MASQEIQTDKTGKFGVKLLKMLTPLAGVLVFLAIWQVGVMFSKVPAYLLPALGITVDARVEKSPSIDDAGPSGFAGVLRRPP